MMPNITRGTRMAGLLVYLAGPGRENEHTEPHLVAGDGPLMAWHDDAELDRDSALEVARYLDRPRKVFGTEVRGGHVWHCSLSLRSEEGKISDQKWAEIARDFVDGMGFTGEGAETDGRAPCRWAAVHHGLSKRGNDHIHIVVGLVREDGTKADIWNDRPRSQKLCRTLEEKHGLETLESRELGIGSRGVKPAEQAIAKRRGRAEPERIRCERIVRGCAAAAADEAEFVRRARQAGLLVRPRFAAKTTDVVTGYSVALRAPKGQAPSWFGGGQLARDLTLPRLRAQWPDSPQHAGAATAEWRAAKRQRRPVAPGRETRIPPAQLWEKATQDVAALRERLRSIPVDDHATWAQVAHDTAGAFAAWSNQIETTPGPLAATAESLSRSGMVRAHRMPRQRRTDLPSIRSAALLLASVSQGNGTLAQAALLRQLMNTAKALHDAHEADGAARRATEIARTVRGQLATVKAGLPPLEPAATRPPARTRPGVTVDPAAAPGRDAESAVDVARRGQAPLRDPGPVLPTKLEPQRPTTTPPRRDRDRGASR